MKGCDVFIVDSLRHTEHPNHFNLAQALDAIEKIDPERAFLTHLTHDLGHAATKPNCPRACASRPTTCNSKFNMTISLAGQTVVVTGGARRLGRAIALECARAGADVVITYRTVGNRGRADRARFTRDRAPREICGSPIGCGGKTLMLASLSIGSSANLTAQRRW